MTPGSRPAPSPTRSSDLRGDYLNQNVDDGALSACRAAVDEYRARHAIIDPLQQIAWTGLFWRRTA